MTKTYHQYTPEVMAIACSHCKAPVRGRCRRSSGRMAPHAVRAREARELASQKEGEPNR